MIVCDTSYNAVLVFISACIKAENDWKKQKIILYVTFALPPVLLGGGQYLRYKKILVLSKIKLLYFYSWLIF